MRDTTGILTSPRASDSSFQALPQQQPRASDSTFQAFPQQQQPRASDSTFQDFPQQQQPNASPNSSTSTLQEIPQKEQPSASQSTSQAFPQQQKGAAFSEQVAPKSEAAAASSSMPTAPPPPSAAQRVTPPKNVRVTPPKSINYPHTCRLCNAKCPGEVQYLSHYTGQKHITAVIESKQAAQAVAKKTKAADPEPSSSNSEEAAPLHACGVCDVQCHSEVVLRSHFNGKRHAKNLELSTKSGDNLPTEYLYCSICDVTCGTKWNLVQHFNGKKHVQNMKEDEEDSEEYYSE
jgi:hypothetical protein